jgi:hypothetical protein
MSKTLIMHLRMDQNLAGKLRQTARKTGLKQIDVARQAMDFGMDELVRRLGRKKPLVEYLDQLAGLPEAEKETVKPSRFA